MHEVRVGKAALRCITLVPVHPTQPAALPVQSAQLQFINHGRDGPLCRSKWPYFPAESFSQRVRTVLSVC